MICRGEGGWADVGRAFMVARWRGCDHVPPQESTVNRTRATIKALPSPLHHPRPYGTTERDRYLPKMAISGIAVQFK